MIKNDTELLREMMGDMKKAPEEYQPGNYWMFYVANMASDLEKSDLNYFRNWVCGPGSVASFGGGRELEGIKYGWNFHPFDEIFRRIDTSFAVKCYNKAINLLSRIHPGFGFLALRSALARGYYEDALTMQRNAAWTVANMYDTFGILATIEDSKVGNPVGFERDGKFYTISFLNEVIQLCIVRKNMEIDSAKTILEIGSGCGHKALTFKKACPKLTYIIVDIPPALYVAQQYLLGNGLSVFRYQDAKQITSLANINPENYDIICLAPWMLDYVAEMSIDLFINTGSFQEMEPWLVKNYLDQVMKIANNVFLSNLRAGHKVAEKGKHGVLKQTGYDSYTSWLSPLFDLKFDRDVFRSFGKDSQSCDLFFVKRG